MASYFSEGGYSLHDSVGSIFVESGYLLHDSVGSIFVKSHCSLHDSVGSISETSLCSLHDSVGSISETNFMQMRLEPCRHMLELKERSIDLDWIEDKFLGSGAYGEVYRYTHRYTEEVLAVKKVNIQPLYAERDANVKGLKQLRNEIDILKNLRHERIVAYHQSVEKEKQLYLFMEYMTGGSLRDKIKSQIQGVLSENLSRNYTQQILEGVCYLHSQQIVHRDIKGDNVLLDKNGDVKLADFGLAKKFEKIGSKTNLVSHVGTPYWMAPEIILGKPYGRKADNWSVGCTVVEMMTGHPPLGHVAPLAAIFRVGSETFQPELVEGASLDANNFIRVALTWDAKDRPQSDELLKHPFICGSTVTREDHEKQASSDT